MGDVCRTPKLGGPATRPLRPHHRNPWLGLILALAMVAAACSGDGGEASTTSSDSQSVSEAMTDDESEPSNDGTDAMEMGPGVTEDSIVVGIPFFEEGEAEAGERTLTGGDLAQAGSRGQGFRAIIDHMNSDGGIAGRQIDPVLFHFSQEEFTAGAEGRDREVQRMCAALTEDNQVFAILAARGNIPRTSVYDCAVEQQTPFIATTFGFAPVDQQRYEEIQDYYYYVDGMLTGRREAAYVSELLAQDFLPEDAQVGLMIDGSTPAVQRGVEAELKPRLEDAGIDIVSEAVYPDFLASDWESYVLQFQRDGVTHVLWSSSTGLSFPVSFFMGAAEEQQYRPEHAFGSDNSPVGIAQRAPAAQLEGAVAVGWAPNDEDLNESQRRERGPISDADALCQQIAEDSGTTYQRGACQGLFWLREALERADSLTAEGLAGAMNDLGADTPPVSTFEMVFSADRHDGAELIRYMEFNAGCTCFEYMNEPHAPPT